MESNKDKLIEKLNRSLGDDHSQKDRKEFSVPDEYFNDFSSSLADKISSQKNKSLFEILLSKKILLPLTIVLLLAGSVWYFNSIDSSMYREVQLSEEDIQSTFFTDELDETRIINFMCEETSAEVSDNTLEQYLIENNIQTSEIENAL